MKKIYYIGAFPGKMGGVTIKNRAVFEQLSNKITIKKVDTTLLKKINLKPIFKFIKAILGKKNILIIASAAKMRRYLSKFLYIFNKKAMRRSIILVMGGTFASIIENDEAYRKWVKEYKCIYVETNSMKEKLKKCGVDNVEIFPNCRSKPCTEFNVKPKVDKLKCVSFSLITPDKGIDTILETAKNLPNVYFDFYGEISPEYEELFKNAIKKLPNCQYLGVIKACEQEKYKILNHYDLFLFPTRWKNEGVPGALIEAKIAGVVAVVSDVAYNAELVENGVSGIVLKENTADELEEAIKVLDADSDMLVKLKEGAKKSGEKYYFDLYIDKLVANFYE